MELEILASTATFWNLLSEVGLKINLKELKRLDSWIVLQDVIDLDTESVHESEFLFCCNKLSLTINS